MLKLLKGCDIIKDLINELVIDFNDSHKINKSFKTKIPNILTLLRLISPLILIPLLIMHKLIPALIIAIIAALTDMFDGKLARKYNCESDFGKKLDAICDKFFSTSLLIPISIEMPYFIINILLEILISLININSEVKGHKPSSNMIGKIKTFFLSFLIIISYIEMFLNRYAVLQLVILIITILMQIWSLIKYYIDDKKKL